jgi:predicted deacylase
VALIRDAMRAVVAGLPEEGENAALRKALLARAVDADLVLDLHCDLEAVMHLYLGTPLWPAARDLAADLASEATLLAEESGGNPFDEAFSVPWWRLARRFPDVPIPLACLAATLELRGLTDVDPVLAGGDADALVRFLTRRGLLLGEPGPLPPLRAEATPLSGVAIVRAPGAGLLHHLAQPGERVAAGDPLATLTDPLAPAESRRREIRAPISGLVFARAQCRLARTGGWICKIAGKEPLPERRGKLLPD